MTRRGKELRIGDAERERAIALLGEHLTAGRIDIHEYDQRCATVVAARVISDIGAAFDDLPAPHPAPRLERTASPDARFGPAAGTILLWACTGTALVLFAVVAKQTWLVVLLALAFAVLVSRRKR